MTKTAAPRKSKYTADEIAAFRAERAALVEGVKTFEPEGDRAELAYDRLTECYSHRNSLLIIMQRPITRGDVQAMSKWNAEGRKVITGRKPIYILAPAKDSQRADVEIEEVEGDGLSIRTSLRSTRKRFVWVRVFDKIDTEPIPEGWTPRTARPARKAPAARKVNTPALDELLK